MTDPESTEDGTPTLEPADVDVTEVDAPEEPDDVEQPARTAGEEDHSNVNVFRGGHTDAPADTGRAPQEG